MLVIMRDQGIALPAGAILISPWCDLTHSFPSVCGDHSLDFIPAHGFLQKPSLSWPPPSAGELAPLPAANTESPRSTKKMQSPKDHQEPQTSTVGDASHRGGTTHFQQKTPSDPIPIDTSATPGHNISIAIDGSIVHIKDQIHMYTTNGLLSHPLVSPVLQPSLGGLPPLQVLTGGGEVLRDEQIYLAHKAANPTKYPPGDGHLDEDPTARETLAKWKPTDVQLQVWDSCCHATPTLSFTHPAKHMYRSIAQFATWALSRAQQTEIEILGGDGNSITSSSSNSSSPERRSSKRNRSTAASTQAPTARVGRAGDPLPPFHNNMIRQRVGHHGIIYDLGPESDLPVLNIPPSEVGIIKPEPVRRWMEGKKIKDKRFVSATLEIQKRRAREIATGFEWLGENPPPSALAGRRGKDLAEDRKNRKSWGMSLWSLWGSIHDEKTVRGRSRDNTRRLVSCQTLTRSFSDFSSSVKGRRISLRKLPQSKFSMGLMPTVLRRGAHDPVLVGEQLATMARPVAILVKTKELG
jgi:acetyl esterase/lipase